MAARIQAKVLFNYVQLSKTDKLWAEAMHWACEALNHTACSANPDSKSPYEMWFGEALPARPSSSQRIVGGSYRRKCCRRVKAVFT